ncbi:MAG TPA: TonB-dependent receptor [Bacteroidota bacterium]|nr:TonB-dependent receptor [Bacteroidota bacterium]
MRTGSISCINPRGFIRVRARVGTGDLSCCLPAFALIALLFVPAAQAQERAIVLHLDRSGLRPAIDSLIAGYGVPVVYMDSDVSAESVSVHCDECTIEELLDRMLLGTPLSWRKAGRQYIIMKRPVPETPRGSTLWGTVSDSTTGEAIGDAAVLLYSIPANRSDRVEGTGGTAPAPMRSMPVNAYGFFSLRHVPPGKYRVTVKSVGYAPLLRNCEVLPGTDAEMAFTLSPEEILMPEVIVRAERSGFAIAEGVSGGTYIPSTPSDHHQYFIEGERIYDPAHQGGVVSTFNDEALNDIRLRQGGLPPVYGGRIGGILDLSLREGSMAGLSGIAAGGTQGSSLVLNGPMIGSTTFLLSGRAGYPDIGLPELYGDERRSDAHFAELIGKLTWRSSPADRVSLTGFFGRDAYANAPGNSFAALDNRIVWRNASLSLRWAGIVLPSLFLQASSGFTGYDFTADHRLADLRTGVDTSYRSEYRVGDISLRADAEHYYDGWHTIIGGVSLIRHAMSGDVNQFSSQGAVLPWDRTASWELSVHLQDRWKLLPSVLAEIGARAASFTGREGSFSAVDPRFSLLVSAGDDFTVQGSLSSVTQFVHPYRQSGIFLFYPALFWYPSTARARPQTALQGSIGAERHFDARGWSLGADAYYRLTGNVHDFRPGAGAVPDESIEDAVVLGDEKAWGVRWTLRKREGRLAGFLRYDLSWVRQQFDSLNGGVSFVPRFQRRHEAAASIEYGFGGGVTADVLAVVASDQSPSFNQIINRQTSVGPLNVYDFNGSRLAGFQRIELGVTGMFMFATTPVELSIRMRNAYGVLDLFDWRLLDTPDIRQKWVATVREGSLFPKYPTLSVRVKFGGGTFQ